MVDEQESLVVKIRPFQFSGTACLSYTEGKLINVEFLVSKKGSVVYGYFQTVAKLLSASLRRNVSISVIIEKLKEVHIFEPSGHSDLGRFESFAEYIAAFLEKYGKYPEKSKIESKQIQGKKEK